VSRVLLSLARQWEAGFREAERRQWEAGFREAAFREARRLELRILREAGFRVQTVMRHLPRTTDQADEGDLRPIDL